MKMNNKGFSMVELIIVIAIMAILVGAIAPTLIKYVNKSRMSADANNAQEIAAALQQAYSTDNVADGVTVDSIVVNIDSAGAYTYSTGATADFKDAFTEILGSTGPKKKYKKNSSTGFTGTLTTGSPTSCMVEDSAGTELYPSNGYAD
ncbi:MAG: type II secretion system protein [Lachnospiraceae bacterium]|nr:type II secretion system protein [Lachnospiraceae bacterium]